MHLQCRAGTGKLTPSAGRAGATHGAEGGELGVWLPPASCFQEGNQLDSKTISDSFVITEGFRVPWTFIIRIVRCRCISRH